MIRRKKITLEHIMFEGKRVRPPGGWLDSGVSSNPLRVTSSPELPDSEHSLEFISWALESAGLSADAYRAPSLNRRLSACLRSLRAANVPEARRRLSEHPHLRERAVDSLLIGTTEFFRDAAVFEMLQKIIAGDLSKKQKPVRIWSAGCSNGAELYSVAILLAEAEILGNSILVGTDCRPGAIRAAREGIFSDTLTQSMDGALRQRYFDHADGQCRVQRTLRQQTQWTVRNLFRGAEKGPWDIILWRNMAIYLNPPMCRQIWEAAANELRPGGWLVVGKAERPPATAGFRYIGPCIYQSGASRR